jgi:hypothetical protein
MNLCPLPTHHGIMRNNAKKYEELLGASEGA